MEIRGEFRLFLDKIPCHMSVDKVIKVCYNYLLNTNIPIDTNYTN